MDSLTFKNGLTIHWDKGDDGGGSTQYVDFLEGIPKNKTYNRCLEWCAGLSAITFSLFDENKINEAVLMDIYEPALLGAAENAKKNNLENKVKHYVCDQIKKLPLTEKFDLVVANPPHSFSSKWMNEKNELVEILGHHRRFVVDDDAKLHLEFFNNISLYLNNHADIFLSENGEHPELIEMAINAGLTYVGSVHAPDLSKYSRSHAVIMHFRYEEKVH